jgi:dTDP-4-dehydrorhamnose reductase
MNVLVIGASGMIGSTVFRCLSAKAGWKVYGSIRNAANKRFFSEAQQANLIADIDVEQSDSLVSLLSRVQPAVVINCAGLTKHKPAAENPLVSVPINSLMPHRLAALCKLVGARFIHVSTDCVFSGKKGMYLETDFPDAEDVYGRSKILGEIDFPDAVTLRTSTIGHELESNFGLLNWFLSQEKYCKGYTRAVFSGLPTVIFAEIIRDVVIPQTNLSGLYHVAAKPIAKFDLLQLIARNYAKDIQIIPDDSLAIDRSLDGRRFEQASGYVAPEWDELIRLMYLYK